jgi:hypothetical protein
VYFLDNSSKMFLLEAGTTVRDLTILILNKFEVTNVDEVVGYFGLFESLNGSSIGDAKKQHENVVDIVSAWSRSASSANAKFIFMVRLYEPCTYGLEYKDDLERRLDCKSPLTDQAYHSQAQVRDAGLIHLQYLQAVYSVITGQFPTSVELALKLGMLHFTYKFGAYNSASHKVGFLGARIVEFIPIKHLKSRSMDQWESALIEAVKAHHTSYEAAQSEENAEGRDDTKVQRQYLDEVFNMVQFGCTMFKVKVNSGTTTAATAKNIPLECFLGVHCMGIHVFEKASTRNLVATYRIDEIFRWGFRANEMFYFEVQSTAEESGVVEFDTEEGEKISALLTDYAHAFVAEVERQDQRATAAAAPVSSEETSAPIGTPKKSKSAKAKTNSTTKTKKATKSATFADDTAVVEEGVGAVDLTDNPKKKAGAGKGSGANSNLSAEDRSAVRIQAIYRGYKDRTLVSSMIEKLLEEAGQI